MKYTILKPNIENFKGKLLFLSVSLILIIIGLGYSLFQFLNNEFNIYVILIVSILSIVNIFIIFSINKERELLKKNKDNIIEIEIDVDPNEEKFEEKTEKKIKKINLMSFIVFLFMTFIVLANSSAETFNKNLIMYVGVWIAYNAIKDKIKSNIIKNDKFEKKRIVARKIIQDTIDLYLKKD